MGEDEDYEDNLKGLFESSESEHTKLKKDLIKIMSPNLNEMFSDEEGMAQGKEEVVDYAQEVSWTDEEGNRNNFGLVKGVIVSYLNAEKSLITRDLLRCKKLTTISGNDLKQSVESLLMPLQTVHFE